MHLSWELSSLRHLLSWVVRRCWLAVSGLGIIAVVVHRARAVLRQYSIARRAERRLRR